MEEITEFEKALEEIINKHSIENDSNTPDWILANFVKNMLSVFADATKTRDQWYGVRRTPTDFFAGLSQEQIEAIAAFYIGLAITTDEHKNKTPEDMVAFALQQTGTKGGE